MLGFSSLNFEECYLKLKIMNCSINESQNSLPEPF